jgi:hypothetical protein
VKYFDVTVPRADVLALWPLIRSANAQSKSGRKPKIPQKEIDKVVFELLDDRGNLSDDDPEWHTQGQLEAATREMLNKKFKQRNVPQESTLRVYVSKSYRQWKEQYDQ